MSQPKSEHTEGFKALWNIIHTTPTADDIALVSQEIAGHDDRIAAVHHLANVLRWMASEVQSDCEMLSYEHNKDGDRYGDNPTAKDHYMSQVFYAYDAARMYHYADMVSDAHEADDELMKRRDALQEEKGGEMTAEEAEEAIDNL